MKVVEIMKKQPRCVAENASVKDAAKLMEEIDCGVLPVLKDSTSRRPIGVITDRDIVLRCVARGENGESLVVRDIATRDTVTCDENCSVADAFERMCTEQVGRLLVTDPRGDLIGIVTMADIIARVPREIWSQLPGAERPQPRNKIAA